MAYRHFSPAQMNALNISLRRPKEMNQKSSKKPIKHNWKDCAWDLVHRFSERSTIHGLSRVLSKDVGVYERSIWMLTLLLALWGSVYVGLILSKRFNEGALETVIDSTRLPVYRTSFPVVTICNRNRLNWDRLAEAKRAFLLDETSELKLELFERIVGTYDDMRFGEFDAFASLQSQPLQLLNHINFTLVVDFMSWRCEEFLTQCVWRHVPLNCCDIFSKRRSQNGICWAFNTLESEEGRRMQRSDPKWPWRTGGAGPESGLNVRALINPEKHHPNSTHEKGVYVMIAEPTVWHKDPFFVPQFSNSLLVIEPIIFFYTNDTRSITSEQRQCVFDDERNSLDYHTLQGYPYMNENCLSECQQKYLVRYCNCTLDILFPPGPYPACQVKDFPCLSIHNDYFHYAHQPGEEEYVMYYFQGMVCQCYRNCMSLNYITDLRPSLMQPEVDGNLSFVDLDVHFRYETLMVYRTSLVFGWVDLMVAFGGIAGLFLGCSLISGMEIVYFVVIDIPCFIVGKVKEWKNQENQTVPSKNAPYRFAHHVFTNEKHNPKQHHVNNDSKRGAEGDSDGRGLGWGVAFIESSPIQKQWKPQRIKRRPSLMHVQKELRK